MMDGVWMSWQSGSGTKISPKTFFNLPADDGAQGRVAEAAGKLGVSLLELKLQSTEARMRSEAACPALDHDKR